MIQNARGKVLAGLLDVAVVGMLSGWIVSTSAATTATQGRNEVAASVAAGSARFIGDMPAAASMDLTFVFGLHAEDRLDDFLAAVQDPASPVYHRYLSVDEFARLFGPTTAELDVVQAWLKGQGFRVDAAPANHLVLNFRGTVAEVEAAFNVRMGTYADPSGREFHSPDRPVSMQGLAITPLAIDGLEDSVPAVHFLQQREPSTGSPAVSGTGPHGNFTPGDIRTAYYGAGPLTGAGQTIGIFSLDGYLASDLALYQSYAGVSWTTPIVNVLVDGFSGECQGHCDDGEQVLDIANAIGMAPGAARVLFYEGKRATPIYNQMASDNIAKVLSSSWAGGGASDTNDTPIFKEMAAQGQTFVQASGDSGAYPADGSGMYAPQCNPYLVIVGGTHLTTASPGGPWQAESAWTHGGGGYLSSGPLSQPIPAYQTLTGVIDAANEGSATYRNCPDLAGESDSDNFTVSNGRLQYSTSGTSFAAPRWAGFFALVNEALSATGSGSLGLPHAALYGAGVSSGPTAFHDITTNGNGFPAVAGYDLATGWGSPNGAATVRALVPRAESTRE